MKKKRGKILILHILTILRLLFLFLLVIGVCLFYYNKAFPEALEIAEEMEKKEMITIFMEIVMLVLLFFRVLKQMNEPMRTLLSY